MMNCNYGHKGATCPSLPTFIVSTVMLAAQVAGFVSDFFLRVNSSPLRRNCNNLMT